MFLTQSTTLYSQRHLPLTITQDTIHHTWNPNLKPTVIVNHQYHTLLDYWTTIVIRRKRMKCWLNMIEYVMNIVTRYSFVNLDYRHLCLTIWNIPLVCLFVCCKECRETFSKACRFRNQQKWKWILHVSPFRYFLVLKC